MPRSASSAAGPTPESCSNWGDPMLPAARIVSAVACAKHRPSRGCANSIPSARRTPPRAAHPDSLNQRLRHHREIRPRQRGPQKRFRRVPPHTALLIHLKEGAAGIVAAIEFTNFRYAAFFRRIPPGFENLPSQSRILHAKLAAGAVHVVGAVLIVFNLLEEG